MWGLDHSVSSISGPSATMEQVAPAVCKRETKGRRPSTINGTDLGKDLRSTCLTANLNTWHDQQMHIPLYKGIYMWRLEVHICSAFLKVWAPVLCIIRLERCFRYCRLGWSPANFSQEKAHSANQLQLLALVWVNLRSLRPWDTGEAWSAQQ